MDTSSSLTFRVAGGNTGSSQYQAWAGVFMGPMSLSLATQGVRLGVEHVS